MYMCFFLEFPALEKNQQQTHLYHVFFTLVYFNLVCFALLCFSEETIFYEFRKTSFCAKPGLIRQLKRCLRNQRKVCHLWCGAFTAIICVS